MYPQESINSADCMAGIHWVIFGDTCRFFDRTIPNKLFPFVAVSAADFAGFCLPFPVFGRVR